MEDTIPVDLTLEQWKMTVRIMKNYKAHLQKTDAYLFKEKIAELDRVIEFLEDNIKKSIN